MTGGALGINRNAAAPPVGRGLAAMTFNAGTGAVQVVSGRTALGIKGGRETEINLGVMTSSQMADRTVTSD